MAFLFPGVFGTASYLLRSPFLKGIQGSLGDLTPTQAPGGRQDGLDPVTDSGWSLHLDLLCCSSPPSALLSLEAVRQITPGRKFQKDLLSQSLMGKCPTKWRMEVLQGGSPEQLERRGGQCGREKLPSGAGLRAEGVGGPAQA